MLTGLEERLREDPSDAKGWLLLAKSYSHLGRDDDAAVAYAKASDLGLADSEFQSKLDGAGNPASGGSVIRGRLTVAESAKSKLGPDDSIFIFAKSTDGSAMPVAVLRKVAGDLPFDFELSDKQAMSAAAKLSTTTAVIITARVSKPGNAMQAEPGFEVVSEIINVGDDTLVELHLDPSQTLDES
jgi:cytochrome c-type biogenesis protein CcmH